MKNTIHKFELPRNNTDNIKLPRMRTIKKAAPIDNGIRKIM